MERKGKQSVIFPFAIHRFHNPIYMYVLHCVADCEHVEMADPMVTIHNRTARASFGRG